MHKISLSILLSSTILLLSGCSTIGSLAGAAIASKTGNNAIVGSVIGGAVGQAIGSGAMSGLDSIGQ